MARAAVFARFPDHRRACHDRARRERSPPPGWTALRHGGTHFHGSVRHARDLILALHDPFAITIAEAAAPQSSLACMFWGEGLFVFPVMLLYTAISLSVFRGKVRATADHY
jgi:hypothetical protein